MSALFISSCWMLDILYSYKYSWAFFWKAVKLLENSSILLGFVGFLKMFLDRSRAVFSLGLSILPYWDKTFLSTLANAWWNVRLSCLAGGNIHVPGPVWILGTFYFYPFGWYYFPALSCFLTFMQWSVLCWTPEGTVCEFLRFSLLSSPFWSLVLWILALLISLNSLFLLLNLRNLLGSSVVPLPCLMVWKLSRQ